MFEQDYSSRNKKDEGEALNAAEAENLVSSMLKEKLREITGRLEDLEAKNTKMQPITPMRGTEATPEIIEKLNYIIQYINLGVRF